jgi:hypothetical protein
MAEPSKLHGPNFRCRVLGIVHPRVIARSEVMRHPPSRQLIRLEVARKNSFDCVRGCPEPISQAACGEKRFVTQKLSY